jgi:hypothetical protein
MSSGPLPAADVIPAALAEGVFLVHSGAWRPSEVGSFFFFLSFGRDLYRQTTANVAVARHWPSRQVVRLVLQIRLWARMSAGRGPRHVLAVESSGAHTPRVGLRLLTRVSPSY